MIKLTVLYGAPADEAAFDEHYTSIHTPLVNAIGGLVRFEAGKVATLDGSTPPYYWMAQLWFEDLASFGAGMGSPEGTAASADVESFASGGATLLLTEV